MIRADTLTANGIEFSYLSCGVGPLALCLHGFPDTPHSYRHLMKDLAAAGYRAVAPFLRGYAPSSIPRDGRYDTKVLAEDVVALHQALRGDRNAVLIGHDWGACIAYCGATREPDRWKRVVGLSVPPLPIFAKAAFNYEQLKKSFYFWFFQMAVSDSVVLSNDLEFIKKLWQDWSPNFDGTNELKLVKRSIGTLDNLQAALGYYRGLFSAEHFGMPSGMSEQVPVWGKRLPQPTLYLHGADDGCIVLDAEAIAEIPSHFGNGSHAELLSGLGHFLLLEDPKSVNARILSFLGCRALT